MLGLSAWKAGEPGQALEAFDRALALDPTHKKSLFNSSRVLLDVGRPGEALKRVEQALTSEPLSNEGLRLLGRAKYQLGSVDDAIAAYQRALAVDERDVWSMNNLGVIYIDQGRSAEAIPPLARAVEIRDNSPVFQNNLGTALERAGHPVEAAKAYEAAIGVDSTYQKASISLARVTAQQGEPENDPVDLGVLSAQFQSKIETWRGSLPTTDSSETRDSSLTPDSIPAAAPDSSVSQIVGLSDSSKASLESVSDTLGDCAEED
jgi:tetratricopeptide (TPR) repeat protein